jgi:zinc and cadmium transporter
MGYARIVMNELLQLFLLALLGSIIALVGGVVFLYKRSWSDFLEKHSVPFAAGVLITVSLVGLLPEAHEAIGENTFVIILLTFFAADLFEHVFFGIHHHKEGGAHDYKGSVPLVIVGDTIHNFIDGVAIGASFLVSPGLGLITALSTFLHEVPHEIGDFGILLRAGWSRPKIFLVNVISASATIVGAFALLLFAGNDVLIGSLLAVSAGVFLYLGASDFLPHIEEGYESKLKSVLPLTIGVAVMLFTLMVVPHSHEDVEDSEHGRVEDETTY